MKLLPEPFTTPNYQLHKLFLAMVFAGFLLILWFIPSVHQYFLNVDARFFLKINHSLYSYPLWADLWTLLSSRYIDLLVGLLMFVLLIMPNWLYPKKARLRVFSGFIILLIILLVIRYILDEAVTILGLQHSSPSQIIAPIYHIVDTFPQLTSFLKIKEGSNQSFPGDHSSVLLIWAFYLSYFARKPKQYLVIWAIALFFIIPRLFAGAHWASDVYIGGLALALISFALGIYTPLIKNSTLKINSQLLKLARKKS